MYMYRQKIEDLKAWQKSPHRKPLIVRGARQVGKTELIREFGGTRYRQTAYVNLDNNSRMAALFDGDFDVNRLIQGLKAETNVDIEPDSTLIVLDEIQEVPKALTALKYFCENAPQYHIVVAGSLLGVATHQGVSFPVGKVDYLELAPLSFREFLLALGEKHLVEMITSPLVDQELLASFHDRLIDYIKAYCYVGGMPEVVASYAEQRSWNEVRRIQDNILFDYANDFSKHTPEASFARRIEQVWRIIPSQLAKENAKFVFGMIRAGARAKEYELALAWLEEAGLVRRVNRLEAPRIPIMSYANASAFKLYHLDVGLLAAMVRLDERVLLEGNQVFTEFRGSLAEQLALQELQVDGGLDVCYWAMDGQSRAEVEFIVQTGSQIVPVEVKSGTNLRAKSLAVYMNKYQPRLAVRSSVANYKKTDNLYDVPFYLLNNFFQNIQKY